MEKALPSALAPLPAAALAEISAANRHARALALSCDPALRSFLAGIAADTLLEMLASRGQPAGNSEVLDALLSQLDPDGELGRARAASSAPGGVSAGLAPVVAASPCGASLADAAVVQPRHVLLAVLRGPAQVVEAATRERVADALAGAPPADLGEYSITSGLSLLGSSGVSYLDSEPAIERRRLSFEAFRALSFVFLRAVVDDAGQVTRGACRWGGRVVID